MVNSTIKELRREAYKMWGIQPRAVVYNMPSNILKSKQDFTFQINYSDGFEEWPKSYTLMVQNVCNLDRIIMPILVVNRHLDTCRSAWYDMPQSLSNQIVKLVNGQPPKKKIPSWQRIINCFLPKMFRFRESVKIEDYLFSVSRDQNDKLSIELV